MALLLFGRQQPRDHDQGWAALEQFAPIRHDIVTAGVTT
jgi:hypothetical protein